MLIKIGSNENARVSNTPVARVRKQPCTLYSNKRVRYILLFLHETKRETISSLSSSSIDRYYPRCGVATDVYGTDRDVYNTERRRVMSENSFTPLPFDNAVARQTRDDKSSWIPSSSSNGRDKQRRV